MDVDLLLCMLQLACTLQIGIHFIIADAHMAVQVDAIIPPHILLSKNCIDEAELKKCVKIIGNSPVEYLYDTIYREPEIS